MLTMQQWVGLLKAAVISLKGKAVDPGAAEGDVIPRDPEAPVAVAKRMHISKQDIIQFGRTPRCRGCDSLASILLTQQSHAESCRTRLETLLRQTDEGIRRLERAEV